MSISKWVSKDGTVSYRVKVHLGYVDPLTKSKRRTATATCGSKKEALLMEASLRLKVDRGDCVDPVKMTLGDFLDQWMEKSASIRLKRSTLDLYANVITIYVKPALGTHSLARLSPVLIQGLYNKLAYEDGLSRHAIKNVHTVLRSSLKQAKRWQYIGYDPSGDVDLPRPDSAALASQKVRYLDPEQAHKFLEQCRLDEERGIVFIFALLTGARPGEYLGLQWRDLDWKNATATIERALYRPTGGGWILDAPKTKSSYRKIHLPAELLEMLRKWRKKRMQDRLAMGAEWQCSEDFVFSNETGGPLTEKNLNRRNFRWNLKKAGLPTNFVVYDLRHTCATLLLLEGEPAKVVSERLGHSSVSTTLDVYSHVLPHLQARATEKLRALLLVRS